MFLIFQAYDISTAIRKLQKKRDVHPRPCFFVPKKSLQKWGSTHKSPQPPNSLSIPTSNARSAMIRHGWTLKHPKKKTANPKQPKQPTTPEFVQEITHLSGPDCPDGIGSITQNTGFDPQVFFGWSHQASKQPSFCQPEKKKTQNLCLAFFLATVGKKCCKNVPKKGHPTFALHAMVRQRSGQGDDPYV